MKQIFQKKNIRFIVRIILFLFFYAHLIYRFYINHHVIYFLIYSLFTFVSSLFMFIDFSKLNKKKQWIFIGILAIISLLVIVIFSKVSTQRILSFILLFLGFIWMGRRVSNLISFQSRKYFFGSGFIFSTILSISYSLFLVGGYQGLEIKCDDISTYNQRIVNFFKNPFAKNKTTVNYHGAPNFDIDILLQKGEEGVNTSIDFLDKTFNTANKQMDNLVEKIPEIDDINALETVSNKVNSIGQQTKDLRSDIKMNQIFLSKYLCKQTLGTIDSIYTNKRFQIPVIILLSMLFWWIIRIITMIASMGAYIIFKILFMLGVYKTGYVEKKVKEIM